MAFIVREKSAKAFILQLAQLRRDRAHFGYKVIRLKRKRASLVLVDFPKRTAVTSPIKKSVLSHPLSN